MLSVAWSKCWCEFALDFDGIYETGSFAMGFAGYLNNLKYKSKTPFDYQGNGYEHTSNVVNKDNNMHASFNNGMLLFVFGVLLCIFISFEFLGCCCFLFFIR